MRFLLSVEHPAWVHQFRHVIRLMEEKGHDIKVVAIKKDVTFDLLDAFDIPYEIISETSGKGIIEKGMIFIKTSYKIFRISRQFKPDMFMGRYSPMMALNSYIFKRPHVIFEDTEHATFCLAMCQLFSDVIITPTCFSKELGKKQLKIEAYKECFYLYPKYFKPDPNVLQECRIDENDRIIILRFISWDAHHDIGQSGIIDKAGLVQALEHYGRVLISSEGPLPPDLEPYRLTVSPEKLHDLLYYATLYIGEGATTASECAVLGTHAIYVNSIGLSTIEEQGEKYDLTFSFSDPKEARDGVIKKAEELLKDPDLWVHGKRKREKLLEDKIDVSAFMVWFIENYPRSLTVMKEHPEADPLRTTPGT